MLLANKLENYPDWNAIEEWCNDKILPDAIPVNVREWIQVADQYDIIVDLYSKYGDDFPENVLGELRTKFKNSYKKSIFECVNDLDKETLQVWITFGFSPRIVKVVEYIWTNITLPQVRRVYARLLSLDIIPVQPMSSPT